MSPSGASSRLGSARHLLAKAPDMAHPADSRPILSDTVAASRTPDWKSFEKMQSGVHSTRQSSSVGACMMDRNSYARGR